MAITVIPRTNQFAQILQLAQMGQQFRTQALENQLLQQRLSLFETEKGILESRARSARFSAAALKGDAIELGLQRGEAARQRTRAEGLYAERLEAFAEADEDRIARIARLKVTQGQADKLFGIQFEAAGARKAEAEFGLGTQKAGVEEGKLPKILQGKMISKYDRMYRALTLGRQKLVVEEANRQDAEMTRARGKILLEAQTRASPYAGMGQQFVPESKPTALPVFKETKEQMITRLFREQQKERGEPGGPLSQGLAGGLDALPGTLLDAKRQKEAARKRAEAERALDKSNTLVIPKGRKPLSAVDRTIGPLKGQKPRKQVSAEVKRVPEILDTPEFFQKIRENLVKPFVSRETVKRELGVKARTWKEGKAFSPLWDPESPNENLEAYDRLVGYYSDTEFVPFGKPARNATKASSEASVLILMALKNGTAPIDVDRLLGDFLASGIKFSDQDINRFELLKNYIVDRQVRRERGSPK